MALFSRQTLTQALYQLELNCSFVIEATKNNFISKNIGIKFPSVVVILTCDNIETILLGKDKQSVGSLLIDQIKKKSVGQNMNM